MVYGKFLEKLHRNMQCFGSMIKIHRVEKVHILEQHNKLCTHTIKSKEITPEKRSLVKLINLH